MEISQSGTILKSKESDLDSAEMNATPEGRPWKGGWTRKAPYLVISLPFNDIVGDHAEGVVLEFGLRDGAVEIDVKVEHAAREGGA